MKQLFIVVINSIVLMIMASSPNLVMAIPDNSYEAFIENPTTSVRHVRDIPPNPYDTKELLRLWNETLVFDYDSYLLWDVLKDNPDPLFGLDL